MALGFHAQAAGNGSIAAGFNALAEDAASMALGQGAKASGGNIAIGNGSEASAAMISGTGYLTGTAAPSTGVSVGTAAALRRITNVADGAQDQDAVTVAQLKKSIDETVRQVNASITSTTTTGVYYDTVTTGQGESITLKNTNNKGTVIHNVAKGTAGTDAVNVDQLKDEIAANATKLVDGKNTTVEGDGTAANPYKVNVKDNINLGEKGANGKDGSIGVNGKDGSAVVINGKDGSIGLNGKDGANGLTIKGGDGKPGVDGTNITRLIIEEKNGDKHDVATLDDGLKFAGNTGTVAKKLNETMTIKGTGTKADTEYDSSNIKTMVNSNGEMIVGLDKNLKSETIVATGKDGKDGKIGINGKDGVTTNISVTRDGKPGVDARRVRPRPVSYTRNRTEAKKKWLP